MSAFLAFRSAAVSVLRPRTTHPLTQNLFTTSPLFQTTIRGLVKHRTHPKNGQIPYEIVQLLDADGALHHAQKLTKILESVDTTTHTVRLVNDHPPTVRIFTRIEDQMGKIERRTERKVREKVHKIQTKDVQFTWFTSGLDFEHKLTKVREELEKGGSRVNIEFKGKKGLRWPSKQEQDEALQQVVDRLADVGTEWRERDWRKGMVKISLQPLVRKSKAKMLTQQEIEELAKEDVKQAERAVANMKRSQEDRKKLEESWQQIGGESSRI